jgi:hypothetical protein
MLYIKELFALLQVCQLIPYMSALFNLNRRDRNRRSLFGGGDPQGSTGTKLTLNSSLLYIYFRPMHTTSHLQVMGFLFSINLGLEVC